MLNSKKKFWDIMDKYPVSQILKSLSNTKKLLDDLEKTALENYTEEAYKELIKAYSLLVLVECLAQERGLDASKLNLSDSWQSMRTAFARFENEKPDKSYSFFFIFI
jgi:hypothetical protein